MNVKFIESLREAGNHYGAVSDLLNALRDGLLIDGAGNKEIIADEDDLQIMQDAILASEFVDFDRKKEI